MRAVRLNNANKIIRACVTEDKMYCLSQCNIELLWRVIDCVVAKEIALIVGDVIPYRIETDEGYLVGYALIRFIDKRQTVSTFIRPVFRSREAEFNAIVEYIKKTALKPVM